MNGQICTMYALYTPNTTRANNSRNKQVYYQIASFHIPASFSTPIEPTFEGDTQRSVNLNSNQASHSVDYILILWCSQDGAGLLYQQRGLLYPSPGDTIHSDNI